MIVLLLEIVKIGVLPNLAQPLMLGTVSQTMTMHLMLALPIKTSITVTRTPLLMTPQPMAVASQLA